MPNIVILTQYFPPEMGAPQNRLWETAIGLRDRGWKVKVITAMPNYPTGKISKEYQGRFSCSETLEDISVHRYWLYASNSKKTLPRILSMLTFSFTTLLSWYKVKKFRPDFLLTESPPLTLALTGLILAKTTKSRHIMNVSDLWPLSAYELGAIGKGKLYNILEAFEKYLYRNSFACTGQSVEITDQLNARGSRKTHLYRNGVDYSRFENTPALSPKSGRKKIVYAGLLGVAQGIYNICTQIDFKTPDLEFHIYGDGAERAEIETYIAQHPDNHIFYHGKVHRNDVPAVLKSYDCTIIPLIKPIFGAIPSKIYEAMAAGLPIIFAGGGEGAKLIEQHRTGWICEPSDFGSMNTTLGKLKLLNENEWQQYRQNCETAARDIFNREIQINQLDSFLKET